MYAKNIITLIDIKTLAEMSGVFRSTVSCWINHYIFNSYVIGEKKRQINFSSEFISIWREYLKKKSNRKVNYLAIFDNSLLHFNKELKDAKHR